MSEISPLSPHIGVEVKRFDLRQKLEPAAAAELKKLLDDHSILLFRSQEVTPEDQARLVETFFPIFDELEDGSNYYFFDAKNRESNAMSSVPKRSNHADFMWTPFPLPVISLFAVECNEETDPTSFSSCARAAALLTDEQRTRLGGLNAIHARFDLTDDAQATHPVITHHPRTGIPLLYVSEFFTKAIENLDDEDSARTIAEILAILDEPENGYVHHWQVGDLLVWDNLALMHGRVGSDRKAPRVLRRVCGSEVTFAEMQRDDATRSEYNASLSRAITRAAEPLAATT